MGTSKPEKFIVGGKSISQAGLTRKMSEVISLREKVAQAELAAHLYGRNPGQNGEEGKESAPE